MAEDELRVALLQLGVTERGLVLQRTCQSNLSQLYSRRIVFATEDDVDIVLSSRLGLTTRDGSPINAKEEATSS